jgi:hypothetical protein
MKTYRCFVTFFYGKAIGCLLFCHGISGYSFPGHFMWRWESGTYMGYGLCSLCFCFGCSLPNVVSRTHLLPPTAFATGLVVQDIIVIVVLSCGITSDPELCWVQSEEVVFYLENCFLYQVTVTASIEDRITPGPQTKSCGQLHVFQNIRRIGLLPENTGRLFFF